MPKKILFGLMALVLFVSACTPRATETTPTATEETIQEPSKTDEGTENGNSFEGDSMPCTTVYGYETSPETDFYQEIVDQLPPLAEDDWVRGNPDAPVTLYEYADFQCSACVGFAQYTHTLLEFFPETIKVVFRHLPLPSIHDKAYLSGMAGEAAGAQGKFWEMHDLLYQRQGEWAGLTPEAFVDWVVEQAGTLDLDVNQFEADLFDEDTRTQLEEVTEKRLAMGMNYTPFVVINDRIFKNNKPDLFSLVGIYQYGGYEECPPWVIDPEKSYTAVLDTSAGEIEIELYPEAAPLAVNSFVFLAQNGWYDEVSFHRVIEGFVAQAGDPSGLGVIGPGYSFANETDNALSFDRAGILAMANAGVDTNGSQFFITLAPATDLDRGYTIFGEVLSGSLDVLDAIVLRDPQTTTDLEGATRINGIEIIEK